MKQLLAISQLRSQSQQVKLSGATFKQEEEQEVAPPNHEKMQGSPC